MLTRIALTGTALTGTAPVPTGHGLLASAYAQLGSAYPDLRVTLAPGGRPAAPADPRAEIATEAARGRAAYGEELRPDVAAGFALHRRLWPTALLFTVPWLLAEGSPLPLLTPRQVHFDAREYALTVDPAGLRVLPGAGPAAVRRALAAHLWPLLRAFRPFVRRGPRMLWGLATDDIVEGLWYIGSRLGREAEARRALDALFPGGTPPFIGAAGFAASADAGARAGVGAGAGAGAGTDRRSGGADARARTRVSCCLYYTVSGAELCATCPRRGH